MGSEATVPEKLKHGSQCLPSTRPLGSWLFCSVFFVSFVKYRSNFLLLFRQANTNTVRTSKRPRPSHGPVPALHSKPRLSAEAEGSQGNPGGAVWLP